MAQVTATLETTGMHCSSCSMLVDITVGELHGVEAVKTDHATGYTVVTFDDSVTSIQAITDSIRSVGYESTQV